MDAADAMAASDVSRMDFAEAERIFAMALAEGWNPGVNDLQCAWAADPDAFIALRVNGKMVAGGSIFRHSASFGFMGLFIVDEAYRGVGLGRKLWHERLRLLRSRLAPDAIIGMDGVFSMESFYTAGGFVAAYETVRYQGIAQGALAGPMLGAVRIQHTAVDDDLIEYDRRAIPYDRSALLRRWLSQPATLRAVAVHDGEVVGFGLARPASVGLKIGPLIAKDAQIANAVFADLVRRLDGAQVQVDVPSPNQAGVALAKSFGLEPSFGCRRMYFGGQLTEALPHIFAGMSLEFG